MRHKGWRRMVVGGVILAAVAIQGAGDAGQTLETPQSSPPTYAIPLRDGRTATVWWDAVSDPAHPSWRCEVPAPGPGRAVQTTIPLTASAGDWRAALREATAALRDLVQVERMVRSPDDPGWPAPAGPRKGAAMWETLAGVGGWILFGLLLVGWVCWSVVERTLFTKNGWRDRLE